MRRAALAGLALLAVSGGAAAMFVRAPAAGWTEVAWPYPRDAWPAGRAFRCGSADCGGDVLVTIRPKIGFCNCATGVSGDDEVDAVADLDMVTDDFLPEAAGEKVAVAGMKGLVRRYRLTLGSGARVAGAGFALSSTCDLVVAASYGGDAGSAVARGAVLGLIGSGMVLPWLDGLLGRKEAVLF